MCYTLKGRPQSPKERYIAPCPYGNVVSSVNYNKKTIQQDIKEQLKNVINTQIKVWHSSSKYWSTKIGAFRVQKYYINLNKM